MPEKIPKQGSPNYKLTESMLDATNEDLPAEILRPLVDDIDNPRSFSLLVRYIKKNIQLRLPDLMRTINFDFGTSPKSFDSYNDYKEKIEQLLEEKDGVIDVDKREQARLLFKVIKNTSAHQ